MASVPCLSNEIANLIPKNKTRETNEYANYNYVFQNFFSRSVELRYNLLCNQISFGGSALFVSVLVNSGSTWYKAQIKAEQISMDKCTPPLWASTSNRPINNNTHGHDTFNFFILEQNFLSPVHFLHDKFFHKNKNYIYRPYILFLITIACLLLKIKIVLNKFIWIYQFKVNFRFR